MIRTAVRVGALAVAVAAAAACVSVPPVPVASTPRHPELPAAPIVPASLEAPADVRARHDAAWQRLQAGDLRGAAREFSQILQQAPGFYPAEAGWAFVDLAGRDYDSAVERFERALAADASYLPAWQGLASTELERGNEGEAILALERVVALDPRQEAGLRSRIELLRFREIQALMSASQRARDDRQMDAAVEALERALSLSPASVIILRELAAVERERGDLDEALAHARRAVALDAGDAEAQATLGGVLEARGDLAAAADAFAQAAAIDDRAAWRERSAGLANRARLASLPPEFGALPTATEVTRAQAAALIGLRLEALLAAAPRRVTEVATDVRGHWAASWILPVTQAGVMEIFPNHTFLPGGVVRRGDLARIVHELLALSTTDRPADLARWQAATPRFADLPVTHLVYRAASAAVTSGAMAAEGGRFQPTRPVTGPELLAAVTKVEQIANR